MTRHRSTLPLLALAALLASSTTSCTGCHEKGPLEKAGEKVDETIDKMKDAVDPKGPAERTGEKIDRALDH